jgi:hypothetical protein
MARAKGNGMTFVGRHQSKGINNHLTWVYKLGEKYAGVDRNFHMMDNKYHCFEGELGHGEGSDTVWYPSLKAAREVVRQYLNSEIPRIPSRAEHPEETKQETLNKAGYSTGGL